MYLCDECRPVRKIRSVMGDGRCDRHGRFAFYETGLKEHCSACAKEKGICQRCGKSTKEK